MARPGPATDLNYGCSIRAGCTQEGVVILGNQELDGTVNAACEKQILLKDESGNPSANSVVVINYSKCYPAAGIHLSKTQRFPGIICDCGLHTVSAITNSSGIAVFRILGYSNISATDAGPTGAGEGCATVMAENVPLGSYSVATPDL